MDARMVDPPTTHTRFLLWIVYSIQSKSSSSSML